MQLEALLEHFTKVRNNCPLLKKDHINIPDFNSEDLPIIEPYVFAAAIRVINNKSGSLLTQVPIRILPSHFWQPRKTTGYASIESR